MFQSLGYMQIASFWSTGAGKELFNNSQKKPPKNKKSHPKKHPKPIGKKQELLIFISKFILKIREIICLMFSTRFHL